MAIAPLYKAGITSLGCLAEPMEIRWRRYKQVIPVVEAHAAKTQLWMEGQLVNKGDYVVRFPWGEYSIVEKDVFEATWEEVEYE